MEDMPIKTRAVQMSTSDEDIMKDVVEHKLNGVMFHTKMMEEAYLADMPGISKMHEYHALEEFYQYLTLLDKYVDMYAKIPSVVPREADVSSIEASESLCHKMCESLEAYEEYEHNTLNELKKVKKELAKPNKSVDWLCEDTKKELDFIDKVHNKVLACKDGKKSAHDIDKWLCEHFKDKLASFKRKGTVVHFSGKVSM